MIKFQAWPPCAHYDDGCAAAHALDLVGERWALLIVREPPGPQAFHRPARGHTRRAPTSSPSACASWSGPGWCAGASFLRRRLPDLRTRSGGWSSSRLSSRWGGGVLAPFEALRRCVGRRFPRPLLQDDVRRARCRGARRATSLGSGGPLPSRGGRGGASRSPVGKPSAWRNHRDRRRHAGCAGLLRSPSRGGVAFGRDQDRGRRVAVERFLGLFALPEPAVLAIEA